MLLITTPNNKGEVEDLAKTAEILGWDTYKSGWRIPEHLMRQPGAVYGELFFCESVAQQMNWTLLSNSLDWLTRLPEEYVKRKITFTTLAEARKITTSTFIKPADDKVFPSKVYASGAELPVSPLLDMVPVLTSDVMKFTSEYRLFVKNRRVMTACCYWYRDFPMEKANTEADINKPERYNNNHDAIVKFVNTMLADDRVECADASVIDVARYAKDAYLILESNPAYASGLYGCERVAALDTIKASCLTGERQA